MTREMFKIRLFDGLNKKLHIIPKVMDIFLYKIRNYILITEALRLQNQQITPFSWDQEDLNDSRFSAHTESLTRFICFPKAISSNVNRDNLGLLKGQFQQTMTMIQNAKNNIRIKLKQRQKQ